MSKSGARSAELQFIFLGTGTSAGVPVIGCECNVCTSEDPRDRRLRPSACFRFADPDGHERLILLDTSPDLRAQALRHGLERCDSILYTHDHVDHTFGLDEVRRFNAIMGTSIAIYAEAETMDSLKRVYRHIFDEKTNRNVSFVASLDSHVLDPTRSLDLYGLRFTPLRFFHGRLPILGYRVEMLDDDGQPAAEQPGPLPLAYCTDVSRIPPETWPRLTGLDTLVLDMLRYREHPTHFSVEQATLAAQRIGARRSWFIHMTHEILHAELEARLPAGMALAHDGLTLS